MWSNVVCLSATPVQARLRTLSAGPAGDSSDKHSPCGAVGPLNGCHTSMELMLAWLASVGYRPCCSSDPVCVHPQGFMNGNLAPIHCEALGGWELILLWLFQGETFRRWLLLEMDYGASRIECWWLCKKRPQYIQTCTQETWTYSITEGHLGTLSARPLADVGLNPLDLKAK